MNDLIERIKQSVKKHSYHIVHGINNHDEGMTVQGFYQVIDEELAKEPQINCYLGSPCEYQNKDIEIKEPQECEWIHYNYRTIAPKHHDINNPYWRIPENMDKLKYCPYCGRKIKVIE